MQKQYHTLHHSRWTCKRPSSVGRRIWQQITDIFAECSIDYDRNSLIAHEFYAMVQNKGGDE